MKNAHAISLASPPERVLIIRPSALGDVCRSVPVLASLRAAWPDARIDWVVREGFEGAIEHHPALSTAVSFPRNRVGISRLWRPSAAKVLAGFLGLLRSPKYDLVLDCQGLTRSGFFALVTGAPTRVGHRDARELGWLGLTHRVESPDEQHTVDRMLSLVEALGIPAQRDMRLHTGEQERAWAKKRLGDKAPIVIAPTSIWPGKRWPAERFASLVERLLRDGLASSVTVVGTASEREQCGPILRAHDGDPRVIDLIGETSVGQLMAVIERAPLVVANDSAALHMAVGFDRPIVGLYGLTRLDLVGPYGREADTIQAIAPEGGNRHKAEAEALRAMEAIGEDEVYDACASRIQMNGAGRAAV